ncbi:MAG: sigma-70 family RNA polymerase sigma factor [Phycisphaerae bacterium]|nr:sigma-70 family RNA polymerase sigma factor [Phycisphaerae bacterium]
MSDVTLILNAIEQGDTEAADKLLPLVYEELRLLATQRMAQERPGQTLQATALVHEAYVRLVEAECQNWNSRNHFFMAAAEAMRRILIENARRRQSIRYGAGLKRVDLDETGLAEPDARVADDLIDLDEALAKFAKQDKPKADLVKLRYFAGMTIEQAAEALGISHATAERHWDYARSWLHAEIKRKPGFSASQSFFCVESHFCEGVRVCFFALYYRTMLIGTIYEC